MLILHQYYDKRGVSIMNKKEVLELRKQFKPEDCSITRICGCYVDGEKEIKSQTKDAFLSLPEEEIFKNSPVEHRNFFCSFATVNCKMICSSKNFIKRLLKITIMERITTLFSSTLPMTFQENLLMELRCSMLQMKFLNMCFAVSVRFTFPKKDFATILRRTMSKTGFVTGLSNHR